MNVAIKYRLRFALAHLLCSAAVVGAVCVWMLMVWYAPPLAWLEGVFVVLLILVAVDVCLGPLVTWVIANPRKSKRELTRDIGLIALVQLAALGYGVYTLAVARPVYVVFNADRFDVVTASELPQDARAAASDEQFKRLPWLRAELVHAQRPSDPNERSEIMFAAIQGGPDLKLRPKHFRAWPGDTAALKERARPVEELFRSDAKAQPVVEALAKTAGVRVEDLAYFPLIGRAQQGAVIVRRDSFAVLRLTDLQPKYP